MQRFRIVGLDSKRLFATLLVLTVLAGCYLRVTAVTQTVLDKPLRGDAWKYYCAALNLQRWHVFSAAIPGDAPPPPDSFLPPGYPAFLATVAQYPPSEGMLMNIGLLQAGLGCATIVMACLFFARLGGRNLGLAAALLTALSPHLVSLTTHVLTETLFGFLLLAGMCLAACSVEQVSIRTAAIAGVILGSSALVRSTTEYFLPFLLVAMLIDAPRKAGLRIAAATAVGCVAVIATWKLRNALATGALGDPALALATLHFGMYPDFMFAGLPDSLGQPAQFDPRSGEFAGNLGMLLNELGSRFAADPLQYARWYLVGKPLALLSWNNNVAANGDVFIYPIIASPYLHGGIFRTTHAVMHVLHWPLVLLALACTAIILAGAGMKLFGHRTGVHARIASALILYFLAVHVAGFPLPRYFIPLLPFMYGFGLYAGVRLMTRFAELRTRKAAHSASRP